MEIWTERVYHKIKKNKKLLPVILTAASYYVQIYWVHSRNNPIWSNDHKWLFSSVAPSWKALYPFKSSTCLKSLTINWCRCVFSPIQSLILKRYMAIFYVLGVSWYCEWHRTRHESTRDFAFIMSSCAVLAKESELTAWKKQNKNPTAVLKSPQHFFLS